MKTSEVAATDEYSIAPTFIFNWFFFQTAPFFPPTLSSISASGETKRNVFFSAVQEEKVTLFTSDSGGQRRALSLQKRQ